MTPEIGEHRGQFITLEGGEGAGKSTQVQTLAARLRADGVSVTVTREPGGSPGAEAVRHVLLSGAARVLGPQTEAVLFAAARDDHVRQVILPALARGDWVICDRFTDSTRVYQGVLGHVDMDILAALQQATIGELQPDLTLILDLPVAVGLARAGARRGATGADRFEGEGADFHERLRQGFLDIARRDANRCALIDGSASVDDVAAEIWRVVQRRLPIATDLPASHLHQAPPS